MCKKTLEQCKTGSDFIGYAAHQGAQIKYGGRHPKIVGPNGGICPVPVHPGDLPKGTQGSIIKMLKLIGIMVLVIVAYMLLYGLL